MRGSEAIAISTIAVAWVRDQSLSILSNNCSQIVNASKSIASRRPGSGRRLLVAEEMQDGEIELVRVLQEGEVACVRENEQPSMRNGRGDIFRMRPFDRLVVVAIDDENGRVDRLQLIVGPVRLVRPHFADLIDEGVVFLGSRRMLGIFMASAVDIGG